MPSIELGQYQKAKIELMVDIDLRILFIYNNV